MLMKARSRKRLFWSTLVAWDSVLALVVGIAATILMVASDRDLENTGAYSTAAISGGVALALANVVTLRWLSDRMKRSGYGELIRSVDRDESALSLPYWIVFVAGITTAILGLLGVLLDGEVPRTAAVAYWAALLTLGLYSLLGTLSLGRLSVWHLRQMGHLQAIQEAADRANRERRRNSEARE